MFRKKGKLICFIGVDGTGKSSHINDLIKYLNNEGFSTHHTHCGAHVRYFTMPLYIISIILRINSKYINFESRDIHTTKYPELYKSKVVSFFWPIAVYFDMIIVLFFEYICPSINMILFFQIGLCMM